MICVYRKSVYILCYYDDDYCSRSRITIPKRGHVQNRKGIPFNSLEYRWHQSPTVAKSSVVTGAPVMVVEMQHAKLSQ